MGREIKRVPLDFDWPMNEVWRGFQTPNELDGEPCPHCHGGETWASRWLYILCSRINELAGDVRDQERGRQMHPYLANDGARPIQWHPLAEGERRPFVSDAFDVMRPSADILDLIAGISGHKRSEVGGLFGRSGEYDIYKTLVEASGIENWGACTHCGGHGSTERYPGQRDERDAWEPQQPPTGEGWQLWETVSEGSPISPVFPDSEGLAQWLTTPDSCWGATKRPMTIEQARGFVGVGWAPSGFITAGGVHDGAEYVGTEAALRVEES